MSAFSSHDALSSTQTTVSHTGVVGTIGPASLRAAPPAFTMWLKLHKYPHAVHRWIWERKPMFVSILMIIVGIISLLGKNDVMLLQVVWSYSRLAGLNTVLCTALRTWAVVFVRHWGWRRPSQCLLDGQDGARSWQLYTSPYLPSSSFCSPFHVWCHQLACQAHRTQLVLLLPVAGLAALCHVAASTAASACYMANYDPNSSGFSELKAKYSLAAQQWNVSVPEASGHKTLRKSRACHLERGLFPVPDPVKAQKLSGWKLHQACCSWLYFYRFWPTDFPQSHFNPAIFRVWMLWAEIW